MSRARIVGGTWTRNVPRKWTRNGVWRTDIFKSVLADARLETCRFVRVGGQAIEIPAEDLRTVVVGGPQRYRGKIWGPFNINPSQNTVDGQKIRMQFT
jgi:hypothetical protein